MPLYDYHCSKCDEYQEVLHSMKTDPRVPCPACNKAMHQVILTAPTIRGDLDDFSNERDRTTGLHGRYIPQLAKFKGDRRAVFKDVASATRAAEQRGLSVSKD